MKAAATAKRRRPYLDVLVLQDEAEESYSASGLPYALADPAAIPLQSRSRAASSGCAPTAIDLRVLHRVEEVDLNARRARITSLETGGSSKGQRRRGEQSLQKRGRLGCENATEHALFQVCPKRGCKDKDAHGYQHKHRQPRFECALAAEFRSFAPGPSAFA